MAEVFHAEVTWGSSSQTNGQPSIWFTAQTTGHFWQIEVRRSIANSRAEFYFYHNLTFISGVFFQNGADFSPYDSGGVLAIEKDEALDQVRWITPLGTQVRALSGFGALNSDPLRPYSVRLDFSRSLPLTQDSQATVKWQQFIGRRDGRLFIGAKMSAANPGVWAAMIVTPAVNPIPQDNGQEASSYRMRLVYVNATDNPKASVTNEERVWAGGDNVDYNPESRVDMAICPITGSIYTLHVLPGAGNTREQVAFNRSRDGGATFTQVILVNDPANVFNSPSVCVDMAGRIVCSWHGQNDLTLRFSRHSEDLGNTFSPTLTEAQEPGVQWNAHQQRFHPISGHLIDVYATATLWRAVVYEVYAPAGYTRAPGFATPKTVASPAFIVSPALAETPAGEWLASYITGPRIVQRSEDNGRSWSNLFTGTVNDRAANAVCYSQPGGLHYLVQQDGLTRDLLLTVSDQRLGAAVAVLSDRLIASPGLAQFAAVAADAAGRIYVAYLTGSLGTLNLRRSDDHGLNWSTP